MEKQRSVPSRVKPVQTKPDSAEKLWGKEDAFSLLPRANYAGKSLLAPLFFPPLTSVLGSVRRHQPSRHRAARARRYFEIRRTPKCASPRILWNHVELYIRIYCRGILSRAKAIAVCAQSPRFYLEGFSLA